MTGEIVPNPNNPHNFRINTEIIPAEVNLEVASHRNKLIDAWRNGDTQADATYQALAALYFTSRSHVNQETRSYLIDMQPDFAVEAGIDFEEALLLWSTAEEQYRGGY